MNKKCYECGNQIGDNLVAMPGIPASFCSIECYQKHLHDCCNQKYSNSKKEKEDVE